MNLWIHIVILPLLLGLTSFGLAERLLLNEPIWAIFVFMLIGCRCLSDIFVREQLAANPKCSSCIQIGRDIIDRWRICSTWRDAVYGWLEWRHCFRKEPWLPQDKKPRFSKSCLWLMIDVRRSWRRFESRQERAIKHLLLHFEMLWAVTLLAIEQQRLIDTANLR